jgi:hypothetical protein
MFNNFETKATLYNLKVALYTDIINQFNIQVEDLQLFTQVLYNIREGIHIERAHYEEDFPVVNEEQIG